MILKSLARKLLHLSECGVYVKTNLVYMYFFEGRPSPSNMLFSLLVLEFCFSKGFLTELCRI